MLLVLLWLPTQTLAGDCAASDYTCAEVETLLDTVNSGVQPLEATLTDIADGTIVENLVNTDNPWADNEVADTLTIGAGSTIGAVASGTMTGYPTGAQPLATALTSLAGLTETNGGIAYGTADNAYAWLGAGAEGTLLMGNGAGAPSWLGAGTAGYFLIANGAADPVWTTQPTLTSLEGLTIANGSVLYGTAADTLAVLAPDNGKYLMSNGAAAPTWETLAGGGDMAAVSYPTLVSLEGLSLTNGDIVYASAADTLVVLDSGTAGYRLTANGAAAPSWNKLREFSTQAYTASGNITEAHILANKYLTNQGEDAAENDLVLPDIEYYANVIFIVNEAYIIEINPPNADAHEAFDLDGTRLDLSDCIDSPIVVGSKISATRMQAADGTWHWSFDTIRGTWVDTGATD